MKTTARNRIVLLATLTIAATASNAGAQTGYSHGPGYHGHGHEGFVPGLGFGFGYSPSTAAESFARGQADLLRAQGEANFNNAQAQIAWEQARQQNIVNRTAKVEQFFALRKFNEEQRNARISKNRLSKEQQVALSRKAVPARLTEENWNAATDGLAWPVALQRNEFKATCLRINQLFRERRDSASGLTGESLAEAQRLTSRLAEGLKGNVAQVTPTDYAAAKRFLASLNHEAKLAPVSGDRLASR